MKSYWLKDTHHVHGVFKCSPKSTDRSIKVDRHTGDTWMIQLIPEVI